MLAKVTVTMKMTIIILVEKISTSMNGLSF